MTLSLDMQVKRIAGDILSEAYFASAEQRELVVQNLLGPTRELFNRIGIPVVLGRVEEYTLTNYSSSLVVRYTEPRDFVRNFRPTVDAMLATLSSEDRGGIELAYKLIKGLAKIDGNAKEIEDRFLEELWQRDEESLRMIGGITPSSGEIYLFGNPLQRTFVSENPQRTMLEDYCRLYGITVVHEVGHTFGLQHAENRYFPNGKVNIMSEGVSRCAYKIPPDFSDEDKAKILSQVCKPEEQQ